MMVLRDAKARQWECHYSNGAMITLVGTKEDVIHLATAFGEYNYPDAELILVK